MNLSLIHIWMCIRDRLKDDTAVRRPFQLKVQFHPRKNRAVLQYPDVLQGSLEAAGMQAAYIPSQKPAFFIHVPSDFRPFVKRGKDVYKRQGSGH